MVVKCNTTWLHWLVTAVATVPVAVVRQIPFGHPFPGHLIATCSLLLGLPLTACQKPWDVVTVIIASQWPSSWITIMWLQKHCDGYNKEAAQFSAVVILNGRWMSNCWKRIHLYSLQHQLLQGNNWLAWKDRGGTILPNHRTLANLNQDVKF